MLSAKRVKDRRPHSTVGIESTIDLLAGVLLAIDLVIAFLQFMFSMFAAGQVSGGAFLIGVLSSGLTALAGFVVWILFRALAEIIRLLKKIAGLGYSGNISANRNIEVFWACSNCGQMLHSETRCDSCGATIVGDDDETAG
ncbi:MAG: hypothetical protein U0930_02975 [Pirellulales bacterium]